MEVAAMNADTDYSPLPLFNPYDYPMPYGYPMWPQQPREPIPAQKNNTSKQEAQAGSESSLNAVNMNRTPTMDPKVRADCLQKGLCFRCKQQGHVSRNCPSKNGQRQQA
jgi:hypothetical protein